MERERLNEEAMEAAAAAVGMRMPLAAGAATSCGTPSTSGTSDASTSGFRRSQSLSGQSSSFVPATPRLFGLPMSGSIGGPTSASSSNLGGSQSSHSGVPDFEPGSRLWFLAKAGKLLKAGWPQQGGVPKFDPEQAVLSCQMHGFKDGLLFLYERMKMFREVVGCYMKVSLFGAIWF